MEFSQEEFIESSQASSASQRRSRSRKLSTSYPRCLGRRKQPSRQSKVCSQPKSGTSFEIPESTTEEDSANISGSLFNGQHKLLLQYQDHDENLRQQDEVLERVLEQSRKAYEQLKLQTESRNMFSEDIGTLAAAAAPCSPQNEALKRNEAAVQVSLADERCWIKQTDVGVQFGPPLTQLKDASVQLSPITQKPEMKDASVQLSPESPSECKQSTTGMNTERVNLADANVQTSHQETRDVSVQKYHSIRVREASVQVNTSNRDPVRNVSKRNVSIQQRSSGMLDLSDETALNLGIELKCDPAHLQRVMLRAAARQCSANGNPLSSSRGTVVEFTEEDPYFANYGYFMDDVGGEGSTTVVSDFDELEQAASCYIEESMG